MGHHEGHKDESLLDKVKNAFGMGDDEHEGRADDGATDDRADGWAGVSETLYDDASGTNAERESGLGRNPGPAGSAQYEGGATPNEFGGTDLDAEGEVDPTREDAVAGEFGGAYGEDDTAMPTRAAWDRGEAPPAEASFGTEDDEINRRETGL